MVKWLKTYWYLLGLPLGSGIGLVQNEQINNGGKILLWITILVITPTIARIIERCNQVRTKNDTTNKV